MALISLDEVERYLVKRGKDIGLIIHKTAYDKGLPKWIHDRFAELRAREQAKDQDREAKLKKLEAENPE